MLGFASQDSVGLADIADIAGLLVLNQQPVRQLLADQQHGAGGIGRHDRRRRARHPAHGDPAAYAGGMGFNLIGINGLRLVELGDENLLGINSHFLGHGRGYDHQHRHQRRDDYRNNTFIHYRMTSLHMFAG